MSAGEALARLTQALADHGCTVRGTSARCPAHEDRRASLSVDQGGKGAVVKCHAGCSTDEVLAALSLSEADLFDQPAVRTRKHGFEIAATYEYTDEHGEALFYTERREPKGFRQYRVVNGRKVWKLSGARLVLYRLHAVIEAVKNGDTIWIAEGEKDVHALEAAGAVATCNPMGAGKWRPEYAETLRGAHVIIVADRDDTGRAHSRQIAASLHVVAASVRTVEAAEGKDAADHLSSGHGLADFREIQQADGARILGRVRAAVGKYVILPSGDIEVAVVLYIAATHAQTAWEHATRLVVKSPLKRCGKTRLMEVAREMVNKPMPTTNISPAALARSITKDNPPALILDEADTVFGRKDQRSEGAEDLRGILNSGHSRGWPYTRWDAGARRIEECETFAMAIIGGIGDLPDTIEDRAVVVPMRRRGPGETVTQWRTRRTVPELNAIRNELHDWISLHTDELAAAEPSDIPAEDRALDVWEPLVAVADLAGGEWPGLARKACKAMTTRAEPDPDTAGEQLLADTRTVFGQSAFLYSATIIAALTKLEESPWAEWRRGPAGREPINARGLARLLKPYGIRSRDGREGGTGPTRKGYCAEDMADAWQRYVRDKATDQVSSQVSPVADCVADDSASSATGPEQEELTYVADVAEVAEGRLHDAWQQQDRRCPHGFLARSVNERGIATSGVAWCECCGGSFNGLVRPGRFCGPCSTCVVCGEPLDPVLPASGYATHPCCDPGETPPAR